MKMMLRAFLLTTMLVGLTHSVDAQTSQGPLSISARGNGLVEVEPDQARFMFSIVSKAKTPDEASRLNEDATANTLREVRRAGIEERHIQVSGVRLQPNREWDETGRRWIERGFESVRDVSVTVNDLTVLPNLVASVVAKGANRVNGIQYTLQNTSLHEQAALSLAVQDAQARASAMASPLGFDTVRAVRIAEEGLRAPEPIMMEAAMLMKSSDASSGGNPEAYAGGLITVRASVVVDFVALASRE